MLILLALFWQRLGSTTFWYVRPSEIGSRAYLSSFYLSSQKYSFLVFFFRNETNCGIKKHKKFRDAGRYPFWSLMNDAWRICNTWQFFLVGQKSLIPQNLCFTPSLLCPGSFLRRPCRAHTPHGNRLPARGWSSDEPSCSSSLFPIFSHHFIPFLYLQRPKRCFFRWPKIIFHKIRHQQLIFFTTFVVVGYYIFWARVKSGFPPFCYQNFHT